MLYPENIETKIGFDRIREILRDYCLGPLGIVGLERISFYSDPNAINQALDQTLEFTQILAQSLEYPRSGYLDCSDFLEKIRIDGMFLRPEEFYDLKVSINTLIVWSGFLKQNTLVFPRLNELGKLINLERQLPKSIDRVIDDKGLVRDGASPELKRIRQEILSKKRKARSAVGRFLKQCIQSNYSKSDAAISIRNGRLVIPVIAQFKRSVQGFIHDESSTGQTSYIEPAEVLGMNNEITDLEYQEKREIVRILIDLTNQIRPHLPDLKRGFQFLGEIDSIQCKAQLARRLEATKPEIVSGQVIEWRKARHPLLFLTYSKQKRTVVPLDLSMSADQRILVISGPNAGGKSVCLKTVALLQYMLQCGLLIPVEEGSSMGIFEDIFIDIGDEQSIENDLSTYSSHIRNMNFLIQNLTNRSLFLIDEFGTGTDPQFGGSIAEAVLEELNEKGGSGIVTTHYSNLKKMARETSGIANAAMRFDRQKMLPLYELEIGNPGSSFSLEIARKMGLPDKVLDHAKEKAGEDQVQLEKMLSDVEEEKSRLKLERDQLTQNNQELSHSIENYREKSKFLEGEQKRILDEAKARARELLDQANRQIESIIRGIKESRAEKETTKGLRKDLDRFRKGLQPEVKLTAHKPQTHKMEIGDLVQVEGQETTGEVLKIFNKDAEILIGDLKSTIRLHRLRVIQKKPELDRRRSFGKKYGLDLTQKSKSFSPDLDLRGKRADEALFEVDRCLDDALLLGVNRIRIIHGKGYGILREVIRKHLDNVEYIREVRDEEIAQGGEGVSVVYLK